MKDPELRRAIQSLNENSWIYLRNLNFKRGTKVLDKERSRVKMSNPKFKF